MVGSGLGAGGSAAATLGELRIPCRLFLLPGLAQKGTFNRKHRVALTPPRIIKMTGIVYIGYFTTLLKEEIFDQEKQMFIVLLKNSTNIIDQCVAQGVPFAREYGGLLANRSFGGGAGEQNFLKARGQTGQQLLLGAYECIESTNLCWSGKNAHKKRNVGSCSGRWTCKGNYNP